MMDFIAGILTVVLTCVVIHIWKDNSDKNIECQNAFLRGTIKRLTKQTII